MLRFSPGTITPDPLPLKGYATIDKECRCRLSNFLTGQKFVLEIGDRYLLSHELNLFGFLGAGEEAKGLCNKGFAAGG